MTSRKLKYQEIKKMKDKKFYLSLICDYMEDQEDGSIDFVLSKAKIMCWVTFFGLILLTLSQFIGISIKQEILGISANILQNIFMTTFVYEGAKKGLKTYETTKKTE